MFDCNTSYIKDSHLGKRVRLIETDGLDCKIHKLIGGDIGTIVGGRDYLFYVMFDEHVNYKVDNRLLIRRFEILEG